MTYSEDDYELYIQPVLKIHSDVPSDIKAGMPKYYNAVARKQVTVKGMYV